MLAFLQDFKNITYHTFLAVIDKSRNVLMYDL